MKHRPPRRTPVNLITGPLGVGKTTTINHLLGQRPADEHWAVLVNEYGLVGVDAALMSSGADADQARGFELREVAGGCICCSARHSFDAALEQMLQRKPDRLLIEPTGLATISGILDTLARPGIRENVDLRSAICLVDPARLGDAEQRQEVKDQVEATDIILVSRSDLASKEQIQAFHSWAEGLYPPKHHIGQIERGQLPNRLLDLVSGREANSELRLEALHIGHHTHGDHDHGTHIHHAHRGSSHDHDHDHDHQGSAESTCDALHPIVQRVHSSPIASTVGWICWNELVFDAERSSAWLRRLAALPGARRTKAVLRTNAGWWGFNIADGIEETKPSGHRRDSRLELVIDGTALPDAAELRQDLRACLSEPSVSMA